MSIQKQFRCNASVVRSLSDYAGIIPEWLAFLRQPAVVSGFFTDPRVLELNLNYERGDQLLLFRVSDETKCVAMVPWVCRQTQIPIRFGLQKLVQIKARTARLADVNFAIDGAIGRMAVFHEVLEAISQYRRLVDIVIVDSVPVDKARIPIKKIAIRGVQTTYTILLGSEFEAYLKSPVQKTRHNIKYRVRKFEERTGATPVVRCYRAITDVESLLGNVQQIWSKSWHARVGQGNISSLSQFKRIAEYGWLRSYVLFSNEQAVAYVIGFQYCGMYHYESVAYDPEWQKHSPGIVLLYYILQDLFQNDPPRNLDFGFGYGEYKQAFGTHSESRGSIRLGVTGRGKFIVGTQNFNDTLFRVVKQILAKSSIPRLLKARLQGKT